MAGDPDHFLLICTKCQGPEGLRRVREAVSAGLPAPFRLRGVDCMAGCERPLTVGFQAVGKASYLFGDIGSETDLDALRDFAWQYQASPTGWTTATERPAALYEKTLARLPALKTEETE